MDKKIIPCLDINNGKVVKGVNFVNLQDIGDPVEIAKYYEAQGADELVFLDISATVEERKTIFPLLAKTVAAINIPLTIGGGLSSMADLEQAFAVGVSKVSLNSAGVKNPQLLAEAVAKYGSEKIVVALDAKKVADNKWEVYTQGGNFATGLDARCWAAQCKELGVGTILVTSMDADGTKSGYDLGLLATVAEASELPIIASGGAGELKDFYLALTEGKCAAVLAASVFHFGTFTVGQVREYLVERGL